MKFRDLLKYLFLLAVIIASSLLVRSLTDVIVLSSSAEVNGKHGTGYFLPKIISSLLAILICLVWARKTGILKTGGFRPGRSAHTWMIIIPLIIPGMMMFEWKKYECLEWSYPVVLMISSVMLAATAEEVIFRGAIMGHLKKNYSGRSVHFYCVVSAILFSLVHLINLREAPFVSVAPQLVYAFFTGLLLGIIMIRVGNVWLLGISHGLLNIIASHVCSELVNEAGETYSSTFSDVLSSVFGSLLFSLPVFLVYLGLLFIKGKNSKTESGKRETR